MLIRAVSSFKFRVESSIEKWDFRVFIWIEIRINWSNLDSGLYSRTCWKKNEKARLHFSRNSESSHFSPKIQFPKIPSFSTFPIFLIFQNPQFLKIHKNTKINIFPIFTIVQNEKAFYKLMLHFSPKIPHFRKFLFS